MAIQYRINERPHRHKGENPTILRCLEWTLCLLKVASLIFLQANKSCVYTFCSIHYNPLNAFLSTHKCVNCISSTLKPICLQPYFLATGLLHPSLYCCTAAHFGLLIGWVIWNHWGKKCAHMGDTVLHLHFRLHWSYFNRTHFASVRTLQGTICTNCEVYSCSETSQILNGTASVQ